MRKLCLFVLFVSVSLKIFSQNFTILGNASHLPGCNCYQLTPNAGNQGGAIFQTRTINLNNSFDFTFHNFFGCGGANGADGEVFVLTTNPNGLGQTGEYLGYGNGSNQPCSFATEFDTWSNGNHGDPGYDHTAFESGGSVNHNVSGAIPALPSQANLDDCQWHTVRIVWDVTTNTFSDYIDGILRISMVFPNFVGTYFCGNPVVNWGWSGATGGGSNLQQVCMGNTTSWTAGIDFESCSTTMQFTDIVTGNAGNVLSWAWSFGDGTTDSIENPLHTYPAPGTYNVSLIITDVNGCTDTSVHTVTIAPPITLAATLQDPPCNGGTNGNIYTHPSGGFGPSAGLGGYTYTWNNTPLTNDSSWIGHGAGTYTVSVTDGVCSATGQYTLNQPPAVQASVSHTDAPCPASGGTGSATIVITGGTPPYTNSWNTTFNGLAVTGLPPAIYVANPTDANGCSALLQYTVTVGSLPCGYTLATSSTNVTCFGGNNGSATLTVTGGVNPIITWSNGGSGPTISGLIGGTYTYHYTDNGGQIFNGSVVVNQPGAPMVSHLTIVNISCGGNTDGQAVASVDSGGVSPDSYAWSVAGQGNNPVASNLGAGPVTVTVTDANGCTSTATGNITAPPLLSVTTTVVNNACSNYFTGTATANPTGGNSPYTYFWSNVSSAQTDLSLAPGNYVVTVTDNRNCTATGSATVAQAPPLTYQRDSANINCFGDATGSITLTVGGGTPGYTYTWSPGTVSGSSPTALVAGEYLVTITDANGCTFFDSIFLKQPATALSAVTSHTDVTCFGANNGTVTITLSGGTPPYVYQGSPIPAGTNTQSNLPPATYAGTVYDALQCSAAVSETVASPGPQSVTFVQTNDICYGASNGSATATFVNATGTVVYNWSNNQTGATINNLPAATYTVSATDANSCIQIDSVTITQPAAVPMTATAVDALCFAGNGSATANPVGGTPPYTYVWSAGGAVTQTVALPAGSYTVTASDVNSCGETAAFTINQPTDVAIQIAQTDINCFGDATGAITLTVTGGTGAYTYTWNPNVSTTNAATALTAGVYNVTVADANNCPKDTVVTLVQPALALSAVVAADSIPCFGQNNGAVTLTTTGGTPVYTYTWNPNVSATNAATNLSPGLYAITVTDSKNCTATYSATIVQPAAALTLTPAQSDLTCFNNNTGVAVANAAGGTTPYNYNWSPNVSITDSALNLAAGNYALTVTDKQQCTATASYIITQPAQLTSTFVPVNVLCNGQSTGSIVVTPAGGTGADTYTWSPNVSSTNSATNLAAGSYSITITDANNCTIVQPATITQPVALTDTSIVTAVLCFGQSNGTITVIAAGGVSPYSYSLSAGGAPTTNTTGLFNGLAANTYAIVLTDNNSCTYNSTAIVTQPALLTDILAPVNPMCYHYANGQVVVVPTGGTPAYNFAFSNGANNSTGTASGLIAGPYSVTVTDANGCTVSDATVLTQPDSVLIEVTPSPAEVKLGNTLQLTTTTNQSLSLTYLWTPSFGLSCYDCADPVFNGVYSQTYTVLTTNQDGCIGNSQFVVTVIPIYDIFLPNAFTPNGDGVNDLWQMFGNMSALKQVDIAVFNRIGEKVFESNDINFKWDGTYKGAPAPEGVYLYTGKFVWLNNHSDNTFKGSITLLK